MIRPPLTSWNGPASILSHQVIPRNISKASWPFTWCFVCWTELRKCSCGYYSPVRGSVIHCEQSNVTSLQGSPLLNTLLCLELDRTWCGRSSSRVSKNSAFPWPGQFVLKLHMVLNLFSFKWLSHLVLWRWQTQLRDHSVAVRTRSFMLLSVVGRKDSPEQNVPWLFHLTFLYWLGSKFVSFPFLLKEET